MGLVSDTADFFRSRLDQMIGLRHPLTGLSSRLYLKHAFNKSDVGVVER